MTNSPPIRIYVNKIENRIKYKIRIWYYLKLLVPETMKLFASTEKKIYWDKNDENISQLEITDVVVDHCYVFNNNYEQNLIVLYKSCVFWSVIG